MRLRVTFPKAVRSLTVILALALTSAGVFAASPIRPHPENSRWLQWRGKATVLITSAEHYGAVLNLDFDFHRYLETLQRDGMNYTRIFAGSYVEPLGAFGIKRNTLAPAPGKFLAPWGRSDQPGYAGGGNKFDLNQFSPEYLARLKEFIRTADRCGVVVELTLFCSTYGESQWRMHPLNPTNNVQALVVSGWQKLNTLPSSGLAVPSTGTTGGRRSAQETAAILEAARGQNSAFATQEKLARWLVRELNGFDNLFFEIQNEPWADNSTMGDFINPYLTDKHSFPNAVEVTSAESVAWQRAIARIINDEEGRLPQRHLIAQNVANFRLALNDADLVPEAGIIHFHYAYPEAVDWNRGLGRAIGYDETGFAGTADATYRRQAWNFVLSGGAIFNNLDYSFSVGHEDGTDTTNQAPGGGSQALRRQLKVLSDFLHGFDLARLQPDTAFVRHAPGVVVRTLSHPGKAYALYVQGRSPTTLQVSLPRGRWTAEWLDIESGRVLRRAPVSGKAKEPVSLESPEFTDSVALRLRPD